MDCRMLHSFVSFLIAALVLTAAAPAQRVPAGVDISPAQRYVLLETSKGELLIELNADKAPWTAANFLTYIDSRFYDGTVFHRVLPERLIQGGAYTLQMQPKPTGPAVRNESGNGLKHVRGAVAMASSAVPDSATSEFFINAIDNRTLDDAPPGRGFAVFGKVVAGMDVVDAIAAEPVVSNGAGEDSRPTSPVVIQSARRISPEQAAPRIAHATTPDSMSSQGTAPPPATSQPAAGSSQTQPATGERKTPALVYVLIISTKGEIVMELNHDKAPISVDNLLAYVDKNFYDGVLFHRVVRRSTGGGIDVIQGGGYSPDMHDKKVGAPIKNESQNGLRNVRGAVAVAHPNNQPDSGTSQFFINVQDNPSLDQSTDGAAYAVFGRVIVGMGVVEAIQQVLTVDKGDYLGMPQIAVVMQTIKRITPEEAAKRVDAEKAAAKPGSH